MVTSEELTQVVGEAFLASFRRILDGPGDASFTRKGKPFPGGRTHPQQGPLALDFVDHVPGASRQKYEQTCEVVIAPYGHGAGDDFDFVATTVHLPLVTPLPKTTSA